MTRVRESGLAREQRPRAFFRAETARVLGSRKISLFDGGNGAAPVVTLAPILFANLRGTRVYHAADDPAGR